MSLCTENTVSVRLVPRLLFAGEEPWYEASLCKVEYVTLVMQACNSPALLLYQWIK